MSRSKLMCSSACHDALQGSTTSPGAAGPLVPPDDRYIVVRGRLWGRSNPALREDERQAWVNTLMAARRAVGAALRNGDEEGVRQARASSRTLA
jgi:hypothetical protein